MDPLLILILLALLVVGMLLMAIPLAALVFIWMNVYPQVRKLAKWSARIENLVSLAILAFISLAVLIGAVVLPVPAIIQLMLLFLLVVFLLFLLVPIYLGILVWFIRLIKVLYARLRIWLIITYLKLKGGGGPRRLPRRSTGTRQPVATAVVSRFRKKK